MKIKFKNFERKYKIIKIFLLILCLLILFFKINEDFFKIFAIVENNILLIFSALFLLLILQNLFNLRYYLYLKYTLTSTIKFVDWGKIFFSTALINSALFGSGHVMRAYELKKKGISYSAYFSLTYIFLIFPFIINIFLIIIEFLYLNFFKLDLILTLIILQLFFIFFLSKYFLNFVKKNLKFLKKYKNVFSKFLYRINKIVNHIELSIKHKKSILVFCCITLLIHFFDLIIFYIVSVIILDNENLNIILLLFLITFCLNQIPILTNIIGLKEIIFGIATATIGMYFIDGVFIQLIIRLIIYISLVINYFVFHISKKTIKF
tara:strand:+ start:1868 stop:2830 length:963 start_codon:yes stop_codon:yes gene_type:complete